MVFIPNDVQAVGNRAPKPPYNLHESIPIARPVRFIPLLENTGVIASDLVTKEKYVITGGSYVSTGFGVFAINQTESDRIIIGSSAIFKGQSEATLAAWVRPTTTGKRGFIYSEDTASGTVVNVEKDSDETIRVGIKQVGGAFFLLSTTVTLAINQWHFVVFTWNAANDVFIYVNGVLAASDTSGWDGTFDGDAITTALIGDITNVGSFSWIGDYFGFYLSDKPISAAGAAWLHAAQTRWRVFQQQAHNHFFEEAAPAGDARLLLLNPPGLGGGFEGLSL